MPCPPSLRAIRACLLALAAVGAVRAAEPAPVPADAASFHLFLLMGQSNMQGQGRPIPPAYAKPHPRVLALDRGGAWRPAVGGSGGEAGIGPGDAFARAYADLHPGVTVGLINGAKGGRALKELAKGGKDRDGDPIYERVMAQAQAAGRVGTLRAVLWHQGEADAANLQYLTQLQALVADVRHDLARPDLPFIAGELGGFAPWTGGFNNRIQALPATIPRSALASSLLLGHVGDALHFSGEAADLFGRRYLLAYASLAEPALVAGAQAGLDAATAAAHLPGDAQVVVNGSMEEGAAQPAGWTQVWTEAGTLTPSRDARIRHGGEASLRIDTGGAKAVGNLSQTLPVDRCAGRRLLVSGWIRGEGDLAHYAACVMARGGESRKLFWTTILDGVGDQGTWMRFSAEVAFPAETTRPLLCFLVDGTGTMWVDDVEVREVAATSPAR